MEKLLSKLAEIKARKVEELKEINEDLIDHAVMQEEIEDAVFAIGACIEEDENTTLDKLYRVLMSTTSNSIYEAIQEQLKTLQKVFFYYSLSGEYRTYNDIDFLVKILNHNEYHITTDDEVVIPTFKSKKIKERYYRQIIEKYNYKLIEIA